MTSLATRFAADRAGATAIEYSVVAAGIAGAVILAVYSLGSTVDSTLYAKISGAWQ
ncbi:Flp family type IVb pilin [Phreatobacter sp. HK31-P]